MPKSGAKKRLPLTSGRRWLTAETINTKRSDFNPDDTKRKGNKGRGNKPTSSSMPNGRRSHANHNGSVSNEPARQRRLGKDVTPSGPKSRKRSVSKTPATKSTGAAKRRKEARDKKKK